MDVRGLLHGMVEVQIDSIVILFQSLDEYMTVTVSLAQVYILFLQQ